MLIDFRIKNYRSFYHEQSFSMALGGGKKEYPHNHFEVSEKLSLLRSAIIFGANASGKSNLIKAFIALRELIVSSANNSPIDGFPSYAPFKFNPDAATAPVEFGIDFFLKQTKYSYQISIDHGGVRKESLHYYPQGRIALLFSREGQRFQFGDSLTGQKSIVSKITTKNQLFLSKGAQNNLLQLEEIVSYFHADFMAIPFLSSWHDSYYVDRIAKELSVEKNDAFRSNFNALVNTFDTGIIRFFIEKNDLPSRESKYEVFAEHEVFDDAGNKKGTLLHPLKEESNGTQKLFVLGGIILRALMNGRVILIDEFERSLHPFICSYIIGLFNNPEINTKNAQLIIATHNASLLTHEHELRRDQVWIIEKDHQGRSELFSLVDVEGIRKETPLSKWYLSGRFGGVPSVGSLNFRLNFVNP